MGSSEDRGLRLIVGIILLLVGLSSFGMLGWGMMGYMFGSFGYLISILLLVLGGYLIYEGLRKG